MDNTYVSTSQTGKHGVILDPSLFLVSNPIGSVTEITPESDSFSCSLVVQTTITSHGLLQQPINWSSCLLVLLQSKLCTTAWVILLKQKCNMSHRCSKISISPPSAKKKKKPKITTTAVKVCIIWLSPDSGLPCCHNLLPLSPLLTPLQSQWPPCCSLNTLSRVLLKVFTSANSSALKALPL